MTLDAYQENVFPQRTRKTTTVMSKKETDHLVYFFEEQILLFKDQAKRTYHKPNAHHVHDLRLTVRRLRGVLWILEQKSSDKKLKRLKKLLGKQREMDVLIPTAESYNFKTQALKEKRKKVKAEIRQWLSVKHRHQILAPLYELAHELQKRDPKNPSFDFENRVYTLKCRVNTWGHRTIQDEELHEFRLAVKKLRYTYEALGKSVSFLKKVQEQLGEVHDLEELCKIFKKQVQQVPQILQQERMLKAKAKDLVRKSFSSRVC